MCRIAEVRGSLPGNHWDVSGSMCHFHCEVRLAERDESSDHSPDLLGCLDRLECNLDPPVWDHVVGLAIIDPYY